MADHEEEEDNGKKVSTTIYRGIVVGFILMVYLLIFLKLMFF